MSWFFGNISLVERGAYSKAQELLEWTGPSGFLFWLGLAPENNFPTQGMDGEGGWRQMTFPSSLPLDVPSCPREISAHHCVGAKHAKREKTRELGARRCEAGQEQTSPQPFLEQLTRANVWGKYISRSLPTSKLNLSTAALEAWGDLILHSLSTWGAPTSGAPLFCGALPTLKAAESRHSEPAHQKLLCQPFPKS